MAPIVGIIQRVESAALSSNWPLIFEQDNCQQGQVIFCQIFCLTERFPCCFVPASVDTSLWYNTSQKPRAAEKDCKLPIV